MVYGKRPPLDEQKSLWEATLGPEGITTGAGAGTGDSFVDAALAGAGANSFVSMLAVLYPGDPLNVDSKDIIAFDNVTGAITLAGAYKGVAAAIPAGVPYKIVTFRFVPAEVAALTAICNVIRTLADILDVTTFTQKTAGPIAANGVTEVELYDGTGITKPTKICGWKITMTGVAWAGHPTVWIEDGDGNKIFPFQATYIEGTDFADGEQAVFNFPVVVPVASGYSVRFVSTAAGDNGGQTLTLNSLDVIEVG